MNTLSKIFTLGTFFEEDPENYKKLRAQWSKMVNDKTTKHQLTMVTSEMYDNAGKVTDFDMSQDAYKEVVNNVDAK